MKRFSSLSIALASVLFALTGNAGTRPHYGGTLHVTMQPAPQIFDPSASDSAGFRSLSQLVFETLIKLDDHGRPQPWLAASWQNEPGNQRWRFQLRSGVLLSDGTPLDSGTVAASLRAANPHWKVFAMGEMVMIEADAAEANLLAELSLPRNSIARKNNGAMTGTGPYVVTKWDTAAKHMTLTANDQYWGGRPFLDSVEVDFGKNYRDQIMQLDLGKSDVAEITPEAIRPAQSGDRIVLTSQPEKLMALVFSRDAASTDESRLRSALAQSIDTNALNNVIFQGGGEPTGAFLPNWLSGYAFLFPAGGNITAARQKVPRQETPLTLGYDSTDATARIIADRIVLNARDVGILLQSTNSGNADIRLVSLELASLDPQLALKELAERLQLPAPKFANSSVAANYAAENALLQTLRAIPLLHLRTAVAIRPNVHGLAVRPDGTWNLSNAWLSAETP